jgi:hypothetical protein
VNITLQAKENLHMIFLVLADLMRGQVNLNMDMGWKEAGGAVECLAKYLGDQEL